MTRHPVPAAVIRWEQPPPAVRRPPPLRQPARLAPIADELRANPGRWGVVYEGPHGGASGMVTQIRLGQARCWTPTGDFDARSRCDGAGRITVYACFVGGDPA